MNSYSTSTGERVKQSVIDARIRKAKESVLMNMLMDCGHAYCENCHSNGSNTRLDCSHNISVKEAKETGRTELCWTESNIEILCRECHQEKDKLNTQFTKQ